MSNEEEKSLLGKAKEGIDSVKQEVDNAKKDVEDVKKIAANLAKGNKLNAAKEAIKMALRKFKDKKFIRKLVLKILMKLLPIILAGAILFGLIGAVKSKMENLLSEVGGFFSNAWKWLTNDYWIDIDQKTEYVVDADTGKILGTKESMQKRYVDETTGYTYDYNGNRYDESGNILDESGNIRETTIKKYTLVDQYTMELAQSGVSLSGLRLLGETSEEDDEKEIEEILGNEETRKLAEKYIAEFIRADIITQQPHRNKTEAVVNPDNQNLVDGGVYFYRNKKDEELKEEDFTKGEYNEKGIEVNEKDYKMMTYISPEEFVKELGKEGASISELVSSGEVLTTDSKSKGEKLRYKYTINPETKNMVLLEVKSVNTRESEVSDSLGWFQDFVKWFQETSSSKTTYEFKLVEKDYRSLISKCSMPYEFLINLCEITQNPEFVYHVALLARDTKIALVIQDNTDQIIEAAEKETRIIGLQNDSSNSLSEAYTVLEETTRSRKVTTTTTYTPVLRAYSSDTWSFYEQFKYTKDIQGTIEKNGIHNEEETASALREYQEEEKNHRSNETDDWGNYFYYDIPGYWWDNFKYTKEETQVITSSITYNEATLAFEPVEKSKQFLGLLINSTGKCEYNCDTKLNTNSDPTALKCAKEAVFVKDGINVKYRIPNTDIEEEPLDKLISGLQMLYSMLQSNNTEDDEKDKLTTEEKTKEEKEQDKKYEETYVVKMQGLVEHLQYLMTFPDESEDYSPKSIEDTGDYDEDVIPGSEFWWPLDENAICRITSNFGPRKAPIEGASTYHKGIDIGVSEGTPIIASADGVVSVSKETNGASGNWIAINHGNGYVTKYMHNKKNIVEVGERVIRGQVIGYVGSTGRSTGPHLHFQIEFNGTAQNPLNYVSMSDKRPVSAQKVTIDDETKLDTIYAIVTSECSSSYEGALAVMSCVLNRCNSSEWSKYGGSNPYAQITATGQFSYGISKYANNHKKYLNGNSPVHVKQAVDDALAGKRNHNYTRFRTDSEEARQVHPNGEEIGGNWYF